MAQTVQWHHYAKSGRGKQSLVDEVLARGCSSHGRSEQEELGRLSAAAASWKDIRI